MFKAHKQSEARRRSAVLLIKYVLALSNPEVLPAHRRELLDVLLWKLTEAEAGKYKTRYRSPAAIACSSKSQLRHDHVFQRAKMIAALERAAPDQIDEILSNAVGCRVTAEEHDRLSKLDGQYDGWERYRRAGISVVDTEKEEPLEASLQGL